jgi:Ala-tRNA(Pro) deacylase
MACKARLETYFRENGVPFQSATHTEVFTASELAAAQHIPGRQVVKVVMVKAGDALVMLVAPANVRIQLDLLAAILHVPEVRLAHENEFTPLFPDCMLGAMPPFGNLYGVRVYLETSLTDDPELVFPAGTHTETMRIRLSDYLKLVRPEISQFAMQPGR